MFTARAHNNFNRFRFKIGRPCINKRINIKQRLAS